MSVPTQKKQDQLKKIFQELDIQETDLHIRSISGSGKGGQKQNKTQNCIHIEHIPTKITVKNQKTRSKETNLFLAKQELCEKIKASQGISTKKDLANEKIRKQKQRRKKRSTQGQHE
jgi:protein subunit release factor A